MSDILVAEFSYIVDSKVMFLVVFGSQLLMGVVEGFACPLLSLGRLGGVVTILQRPLRKNLGKQIQREFFEKITCRMYNFISPDHSSLVQIFDSRIYVTGFFPRRKPYFYEGIVLWTSLFRDHCNLQVGYYNIMKMRL